MDQSSLLEIQRVNDLEFFSTYRSRVSKVTSSETSVVHKGRRFLGHNGPMSNSSRDYA